MTQNNHKNNAYGSQRDEPEGIASHINQFCNFINVYTQEG